MTEVVSQPGTSDAATARYDAVVVGAGFAGIYMLHKLRGLGFTARVFETGTGVGGTWFWNRYPGARCDAESMFYSYSFDEDLQQEWSWTERYATQPEILGYLNHVVDRFDLRRDIQLETRVTTAHFDEESGRWHVTTDRGDAIDAQFLVMATGCLSASAARVPDLPGIDTFRGRWYHTCDWPEEGVDFTGQRVGIIGTGSSGVQAAPQIARQAKHLTVFQRTANFSVPARNRPLDEEVVREVKANYAERREAMRHSNVFSVSQRKAVDFPAEEVVREFEARWGMGGPALMVSYDDLLIDERANQLVSDFVRSKIRETVKDPAVAELLAPKGDLPFGTKRLCIDIDYYETFNRDNVSLVDVEAAPIVEITPSGLRTTEADYELDAIVFATGFDAMTGALFAVDIRGRGGRTLPDKWHAGPRTYLGIATAEFPNLFTITGPGSPSVISNMVVSIEQHVDWIGDLVAFMRDRGYEVVEADRGYEDRWVEHVNEVANGTLYPKGKSWYLGANVPGKPRVFMPYVGGVGVYRDKCDEVAANDYEGFTFTT